METSSPEFDCMETRQPGCLLPREPASGQVERSDFLYITIIRNSAMHRIERIAWTIR